MALLTNRILAHYKSHNSLINWLRGWQLCTFVLLIDFLKAMESLIWHGVHRLKNGVRKYALNDTFSCRLMDYLWKTLVVDVVHHHRTRIHSRWPCWTTVMLISINAHDTCWIIYVIYKQYCG